MIYLIKPERLMYELRTHAKGQGRGILNWYINSEDGLLHIYYHFAGVDYLTIMSPENVPIEIKTYLSTTTEILGYYEKEEEEDLIEHPLIELEDYNGR